MPGYTGTISRTAPALGMTSKALRATLSAGGLLDVSTGEPTREAVVHGAAFMVERPSANGYYRATVWREDGILSAIPEAMPDHQQVLSSFRNKRAALRRLEEAVELLREASGAAVRRMFDAIGFAELREASLRARPAERERILGSRLRPLLTLVERTAAGETERDAIAVADGALRWLCDPAREGPRRVVRTRVEPDDEPTRDAAVSDGRLSLRLSPQEAMLLNAGSRIGAADADPVSSRLSASLLAALARAVDPCASDDEVRIASGMATRTCGTVGRRTLLVLRPAGPSTILASAHEARVDGGSVTIGIDPTATAVFHDDSDVPESRSGPDRLIEALCHLLSTELARARRAQSHEMAATGCARRGTPQPVRSSRTGNGASHVGSDPSDDAAPLRETIADLTARLAAAEARAERAERERDAALRTSGSTPTSEPPAPARKADAASRHPVAPADDHEATVRSSIMEVLAASGPASWSRIVEAAGLRPNPTLIGIRSRMLSDGSILRDGESYRAAPSDVPTTGEGA